MKLARPHSSTIFSNLFLTFLHDSKVVESFVTGEVQLFDAFNLQAKIMIPAHESPLAALTFNPSGTRLATASEKGTVIRVFSVEDGARLVEFRYASWLLVTCLPARGCLIHPSDLGEA